MHPSIPPTLHALCRRASLPASLLPAQLRYLPLRALAALWKKTQGERFAIAAGSAGELEACALALEKAVGGSPASNLIGHGAPFRLLGAHESGEDFLELELAVLRTPGGHEVALIAALDLQPPEGGGLFFAVLRSEPPTGTCEEGDFHDAYGALLEFFSERAPASDLPATDDG